MTRTNFLYFINTYCGGDVRNVIQFTTDNHPALYVSNYTDNEKRGIKLIDELMIADPTNATDDDYLTGVLLYSMVAPSGADYPNQYAEWFYPVEHIQGIARIIDEIPTYVPTYTEAYIAAAAEAAAKAAAEAAANNG